MPQSLRVLILEDNTNDAEILLRALKKENFEVNYNLVDNKNDFISHLNNDLDIILADYQLPSFNGLQALEIVKSHGFDIPFILISETTGEEFAVEAILQGASDYLMKNKLHRLGTSVRVSLDNNRLQNK